MASGYGLSRMIQGGFEGLDKGLARRDLGKQRERADTEFEQGQEDRDYMLDRQEITDAREDEQYRIQKKQQDRAMDGMDATRDFMMTGNVDRANEFMNKYTPEGMKHQINKTKDGGYEATIDFEGKSETQKITEDDIGTYMQMLMTSDPYAKLEEQISMKRAAETKGADRKHDMAKIAKKHEGAVELEHIKGGYKVDAAKGKGAGSGKNLPWQKELNDLAKEDYGSVFGDQWKFDTTRDKAMRSAHADMSTAYYMQAGDENTNAAHRKASVKMRQFLGDASEQADQELDEGLIDKKQYDNRVADIIDALTDYEIKQQAPKPGEVLERGAGTNQAPSGATSPAGVDVPEDHIQMLIDDPSQAMKDYFDEAYGDGAADAIMNDAGVDSGGYGGLIKDANAADKAETVDKPALQRKEKPKPKEKKPGWSGQKERSKIRRSQKDHKKIAISEYKNEWKNMSNQEKLDWWSENSGALKSASERSYRKARKEIRAMKSSARFEQQNKEGIKAGRENYALQRGE